MTTIDNFDDITDNYTLPHTLTSTDNFPSINSRLTIYFFTPFVTWKFLQNRFIMSLCSTSLISPLSPTPESIVLSAPTPKKIDCVFFLVYTKDFFFFFLCTILSFLFYFFVKKNLKKEKKKKTIKNNMKFMCLVFSTIFLPCSLFKPIFFIFLV